MARLFNTIVDVVASVACVYVGVGAVLTVVFTIITIIDALS